MSAVFCKVLATGGLSYPHLGTDGRGHQVLTKLGHRLHPMYPALTPLKGSHPGQQQLAGKLIKCLLLLKHVVILNISGITMCDYR